MMYFWMLLTCAGTVALDQLVKYLVTANIPLHEQVALIPGVVHLTNLHNAGAAFSMLEGKRTFFLILTAVFLIAMVVCAVKKIFPKPYLWILTVITGGAVGNLIDRVANGYVVDMFEVEFMDFAVFNVADIFITVGAVVLVVYTLFFDREKKA